jgi:putative ABC transport system substrate-binding protein
VVSRVQRRQFLIAAGSFLAAPFARAQARALPVIGYLSNSSLGASSHLVAAFRRGLGEAGYVEGKNVAIEYRWADGRADQVPGFAADFVRRQVAVIVATGGSPTWLPAKGATATIPIVFSGGGDPVRLGLVSNLGRPGGNATGITTSSGGLTTKRLQLLSELVPAARLISVLVSIVTEPESNQATKEIQAAARALGLEIRIVNARGEHGERGVDVAFAEIVKMRAGALLVSSSAFLVSRRAQLVALAAKHAIPASYAFPEFVDAGGLMSYGVNLSEVSRQVGVYAGRILKGTKPADLPVLQPTVFELALNSKTANALGVKIPQSLLARADRVVE